MDFTSFYDKTHAEILEILLNHLHEWEDAARENAEMLEIDSRSMSFRNKGREIAAAIAAISNLIDELGIDTDELD